MESKYDIHNYCKNFPRKVVIQKVPGEVASLLGNSLGKDYSYEFSTDTVHATVSPANERNSYSQSVEPIMLVHFTQISKNIEKTRNNIM
jgi:hypothetical protein